MKYMLMMNAPRWAFDQYASWPRETLQAHTAFMSEVSKQLKDSGE